MRARQLRVIVPEKFRRDLPKWLGTTYFADAEPAI
jgi:hypothetical protein